MKLYTGMDLHSNNTYIGISDEDDNRVFKGRFPNQLPVILKVLEPYKEKIVGIVVESTFNWYWLVDGMMENGYEGRVHLAHPAGFNPYKGLKHSNDKTSAFFLGKLLRLGILPEGHILPKEDRHLRDLLRKRLMLVQQRTDHLLSLKSLLNRNFCLSPNRNELKRMTPEDIDVLIRNEHLNLSAKADIDVSNHLESRIKQLEKKILADTIGKPYYLRLLTVPGIGKVLALTITLETGDINRFKDDGNYASYSRCVSSKCISNERNKGSNNRKNGNKYLGWAFVEAANFMTRYCPEAGAFHMRKCLTENYTLATKALACKIAKACFYIMRDDVDFDVEKMFGKPLPLKSKKDKGRGSKPDRGLDVEPRAPIGKTAAADFSTANNNPNIKKMQDKN
jgi:transposase